MFNFFKNLYLICLIVFLFFPVFVLAENSNTCCEINYPLDQAGNPIPAYCQVATNQSCSALCDELKVSNPDFPPRCTEVTCGTGVCSGIRGLDELAPGKPNAPDPLKIKLGVTIPGLEEFSKGDGVEVTDLTLATYIGGIYRFLVGIAGILAILVIAFGGIIWIFSSGSPDKITKAKELIVGAITGLILALSSYLILYTINPNLTRFGPLGIKTVTYNGQTFDLDGHQCDPMPGPCAVENLGCFGDKATQASGICRRESQGGLFMESGTDYCQDANGQPRNPKEVVSFGLFQINISAHPLSGKDCPAAFDSGPYTGRDKQCSIKNQTLYNTCKNLALANDVNIQKACEIYKANGWGAWGANLYCKF